MAKNNKKAFPTSMNNQITDAAPPRKDTSPLMPIEDRLIRNGYDIDKVSIIRLGEAGKPCSEDDAIIAVTAAEPFRFIYDHSKLMEVLAADFNILGSLGHYPNYPIVIDTLEPMTGTIGETVSEQDPVWVADVSDPGGAPPGTILVKLLDP